MGEWSRFYTPWFTQTRYVSMCGQCIKWGGKTWHRYKGGHYVTTVRLHREMWEEANGHIPDGFDVHHVDEDKGHNSIDNFELLSHSEHSARHIEQKLAPHREKALANALAVRRANSKQRLERELVCVQCGGIYSSGAKTPKRFCSSACVEQARSGAFKGEQRKCEYCAESYTATKRVQRYCSRKCNQLACEVRANTLKIRTIECTQCEQAFQSSRSNARFCSRPCAIGYHGRHSRRGKIARAS